MQAFAYVFGTILLLGSILLLFFAHRADAKVRRKRDSLLSEAYEYFKRQNELNQNKD